MTLSVLIVGCGTIAGGFDAIGGDYIGTHAKAYLRHGGFRLTACVDPDVERGREFARKWGVQSYFPSLTAIEQRSFDVVSLCSPSALHHLQLRELLNWPVRLVFCEKPLTLNFEESRGIVASYEAAKRHLAVNYQRRWDRSVRQLRQERWGQLLCAHGYYTKGILTNGSHLIDLAQYLLGPLTLDAVTDKIIDLNEEDPTIGCILRDGNDAPVTLSVGDRRLFTLFELDLLFEEGRVTFGDSGFQWSRRRIVDDPRHQGYRVLEPAVWQATSLEQAMAEAVANISEALTENATLLSTGESALATHRLCADLKDRAVEQNRRRL